MSVERTSDGWYFGKCIQIPKAFSQGRTITELKINILDAINLMLSEYSDTFPLETTHISPNTISISHETKQIIKPSHKKRVLS